jgi:hypothetical protein
MRGEPKQGSEHSCVVGKRKTAPKPREGSIAPSNDEVGKRRKQDTAYSHGRVWIKGAVVSRDQVLNERQFSCELLNYGPKVTTHSAFMLLEGQSGGPVRRGDYFHL